MTFTINPGAPIPYVGETAEFVLQVLDDLDQRVLVLIQTPSMPAAFEATYGCRFVVEVGDAVLCPPTNLHPEPHVGIVTALTGGDYDGPIKYLIRKIEDR